VFTPQASGTRNATITVNDNDLNNGAGQQALPVTGTGGVPNISVGFVSQFSSPGVGIASDPGQVVVTNFGLAPLAITGISTTGDFTQTNNCGAGLGVGQSCTVTVTFIPTAVGTRNGSIVVTSNTGGVPSSSTTRAISGRD